MSNQQGTNEGSRPAALAIEIAYAVYLAIGVAWMMVAV